MTIEQIYFIGAPAIVAGLFVCAAIESRMKKRSVKGDLREAFELGKKQEARMGRFCGHYIASQVKTRRTA